MMRFLEHISDRIARIDSRDSVYDAMLRKAVASFLVALVLVSTMFVTLAAVLALVFTIFQWALTGGKP